MTADVELLPCSVEHELRVDAAIIRNGIDGVRGPINREALADRLDRYAHAAAAQSAEIEALRAEIERFRSLEAEAAESVELPIINRTAFTGEAPYVGWRGLGRALNEALDERDALRAEVAAWRELSDHVRVGACAAIWPDRYTDARTRDVAAALKRAAWLEEAVETLRAEVEKVTCELMDVITRADKLAEALRRYRNEVPLGHQPHMLAHEVDDLLRDQESE